MKYYGKKDCDLALLRGRRVGMLGFGAQGSAQAQNLKDSGIEVLIGLREDSPTHRVARDLGFESMSLSRVVQACDLICFMIPDELHQEVFESAIAPHLTSRHTLLFCHGFSVHFGLVKPPEDVGVILVAPKGQGKGVRDEFLANRGVPDLIAVHQENSQRNAKSLALAYAAGIGGDRSFIIETSFKDECEMDLFGEQAVLCGGLRSLMLAGFETLVQNGYPAELAYFECLHELKLVVDLFYHQGLQALHQNISNTAEYGMITRGERLITQSTRDEMKKILTEIQNGDFAREFMREYENKSPLMQKARQEAREHLAERVGIPLRQKIAEGKSK